MINKLCLGTAQFGFEYGINNKYGKPSKEEIYHMMDYARDNSIEVYDTAVAYGEAEEILGEYIRERKLGSSIKVISKLKPNTIDENSKDNSKIVREQIENSIKRLNINSLEGYLLHTPTNFYNESTIDELCNCKKEGLVKNIGVSIYETKHALDVVNSKKINFIQVPYSVFDQRLNNTDFFEIAKKNNVTVFARSAFIQGLILMKDDEIPENLSKVKLHLDTFDKIIDKYNLTRLEAALLFSYDNPGIDYLVFGVDSIDQLKQNIDIPKRHSDFKSCMEELLLNFTNVEESIIIPSLWAKK